MARNTRQAIIEAARKHFSTLGYDAASMDGIASEARVTKVTVYRHFDNKESLFAAALQSFFDELPAPGRVVGEVHGSLRAQLVDVAENILALGTGPLMAKLHRMLALPRDSAPQTAAALWETNFQPYHEAMQQVLAAEAERGTLEIADVELATTHFLSLIAGEPMVRLFLTGSIPQNEAMRARHVSAAVDAFLRAYRSSKPVMPGAGDVHAE